MKSTSNIFPSRLLSSRLWRKNVIKRYKPVLRLIFCIVLLSSKKQNSGTGLFFVPSSSPIWPHKHPLISISANSFVTGVAFACAFFVVFTGWQKCTCNKQSERPSNVAIHAVRPKELVFFWGLCEKKAPQRECDRLLLTRWIDGNNTPIPNSALRSSFVAASMWRVFWREADYTVYH